jgi:lysophospholipid acyltransferase (LPLAT)-like uncharacterized protein
MALFFRLWLATLRFRCNVERIDDSEGPVVLLLWHDKLFVSSWIANRYFSRPVTALISTSKDGAWLVAFFRFMGIAAVRGSSNRRGAAALITLTRSMRAGNHTGITPDGPKGPALEFKTGAVSLARLTRSPFVVMGIRLLAHAQLGSIRDADSVLESGSHLGARADACGRRTRRSHLRPIEGALGRDIGRPCVRA